MTAGQQLIGGFVTIAVGVIVIAAIYQLNKRPTVANDTTQLGARTLTSIFS